MRGRDAEGRGRQVSFTSREWKRSQSIGEDEPGGACNCRPRIGLGTEESTARDGCTGRALQQMKQAPDAFACQDLLQSCQDLQKRAPVRLPTTTAFLHRHLSQPQGHSEINHSPDLRNGLQAACSEPAAGQPLAARSQCRAIASHPWPGHPGQPRRQDREHHPQQWLHGMITGVRGHQLTLTWTPDCHRTLSFRANVDGRCLD